jgi:hypothetical protein
MASLPGDDQERVVDADTDSDHRGDLTREVGRVDDGRPDANGCQRDEDACDGGRERQSHCDDRPEREQQDHRGGQQAEQLGGRHLLLGEHLPAEGDVDRRGVGDLAHLNRDVFEVRRTAGAELDGGERNRAVLGHTRRVVERRRDRGDARQRG